MRIPMVSLATLLAGMVFLLQGCQRDEPAVTEEVAEPEVVEELPPAWIDQDRMANADSEPENWLAHGRTWSEQRYSPLDQINDQNVGELGLAWYFDLDTKRGQQASPIIVDGTMYSTSAWSKVQALDAKTGELKWQFDPEIHKSWDAKSCCGVANRGAAVWKGRVFVGTIDGRLIALNSETGEVEWEVQTTDASDDYSITGAPRVANDLVIIGNGGAEYGVRGYVTAYHTDTGEQAWRFWVVPGNPAMVSRMKPWKWRPRRGPESGGPMVVAVPPGTHSPTIRISISCTSARGTDLPGHDHCEAPAAAIIYSSARLSQSMRVPASMSGTTKPYPVTPGTIRRSNT